MCCVCVRNRDKISMMKRRLYNILIALSVTVLDSCNVLEDGEQGVAFMIDESIPSPLAVEVKSATEPEVTAEQIDAFALWVDGTKISGTYGQIKDETYKLKTGSYTAHAQNCTPESAETNPDAYGCVRYYGVEEFEVNTLATTQNVTLTCSIANSRVAVVLSDDFRQYFVEGATDVRISDAEDFSSRSLQMIADGAQTASQGVRAAYFTAGDPVYAEVTTRKIGADRDVAFKVKVVSSAQPNTSYTVSLSVDENSTSGGITFKVGSSDLATNDFLSIESYTPVTDGYVEDK